VVEEDRLPFRTSYGYYAGPWPLEHHAGARLVVSLYRAVDSGIVPSSWTVGEIAAFAREAGGETASWSVPALVRALETGPSPSRMLAVETLAALGPRATGSGAALARVLTDPRAEPPLRAKAAHALGRIGERGPAIVGALSAAADAPTAAVRLAASDALRRLGGS
jgi:hypothetical protein